MIELESYEERMIKDWAAGAEVMFGAPASDKVVDILVDGILDFKNAWSDKGYPKLNTYFTPVVLLSKKKILELCDVTPIDASFVKNDFGLAYTDLVFNRRINRWKYIHIPTLYIMENIDNMHMLPDEVNTYMPNIEITDAGRTEKAYVDIMRLLVKCNSMFRTFMSMFRRESLGEYVARNMVKLGYAKYIK